MLRKSTLLALAASAALGLATLAPTSASAHFGGGHGGGGMHFGGGGHWGDGGHWGHGIRFVHWHRPIVYGVRPVYVATRPVIASTPGPCTCLSKEYTPEGAVLFKDRCTNEMAMNPPPAPPQQTGEIESTQQQASYQQQYVQPTPQPK